MPTANSGARMREQTRCIVCQSEIDADAKKCIKCSSYQDRSRHFFKYSPLVTAMVAIVSLGSIALSLGSWVLTNNRAILRMTTMECKRSGIIIGYINKGGLGAVISDVSLRNASELGFGDTFSLRPQNADGFLVVEPGGSPELIEYKGFIGDGSAQLPTAASHGAECKYSLDVMSYSFDGNSSTKEISCDCPA